MVFFMLDCARPIGDLHIDGFDTKAVSLRVFDEDGGHVKTHGLVVEDGAGESSEVLHFEVCGGIRNQSEARSMRFGKAIQRKGTDVLLRRSVESVRCHASLQFSFEILHPLPGAPHILIK